MAMYSLFEIRQSIRRVRRTLLRAMVAALASGYVGVLWLTGNSTRSGWVFGGCSGRVFADNSAALFSHVRRMHPEIKACWIIDRESPDVPVAKSIGPVLFNGSIHAHICSLLAQVVIISHGSHDVPASNSAFNSNAVRVRLGHGLTAFKRTKGSAFHPVSKRNRAFDLVPVASIMERKNKATWGIEPQKLVITGLARHDELLRTDQTSSDNPSSVLYMPTWRDWLVGQSYFTKEGANFAEALESLIRSRELEQVLEQWRMKLKIGIHMGWPLLWADWLRDLAGEKFQVVEEPRVLQQAIVNAKILVTDYSSVAWDALYINRLSVFYQFDSGRFLRDRGSHIDLQEPLFGPTTSSASATIREIERLLSDPAYGDEWRCMMKIWKERAFAYRDDQNCRRIVDEIKECVYNRAIRTST